MTVKLEGHNLGAKHRNLNELSTKSEEYSFKRVDFADGDIINLIKIDKASKNKNVDYILKVLVCDDLLFVSKAIKQSPWLTESEYKHIINPTYLKNTLYPLMTSKAVKKLKQYIMLNLKDSSRVEEFYEHEEDPKKKAEWLPHCSKEFILTNIVNHKNHIDITLLKRLCEKSATVFKIHTNDNQNNITAKTFQSTMFLLNSDTELYLDVIEKQPRYLFPKFNKSSTELIMKKSPDRIIRNFKTYCHNIHIQTFLKYLKRENIKGFLLDMFNEKRNTCRGDVTLNFKELTTFVSSMPDDDRVEFITQVLIDKIHDSDTCTLPKPLQISMHNVLQFTKRFKHIYHYDHYWYRFLPFGIAFSKIRDMINGNTPHDEVGSLLNTLIIAAAGDNGDIKILIDYYNGSLKNTKQSVKNNFVTNLIQSCKIHDFDEDMWCIMENTFMKEVLNGEIQNEEAYDKCYTQMCVEAIIINYTLHKKKISKHVEDLFSFNSMKKYQTKLNKEQSDILFTYLYNTIIKKINNHATTTKEEFLEKTYLIDQAMDLLRDWSKDLMKYPAVVNAIKDLINVNEQNKWDEEFKTFYNKQRSWRKVLFHESIRMYPSQSVLINAIKHDPEILNRYKEKVDNIYFNNKIDLKQYHKKIRIYWSQTLAKQLINKYLERINDIKNNKAVVRALCILMPEEDLKKLVVQNAPTEENIDWNNLSEVSLITKQNLAKLMHIARPKPSPTLILKYCKKDYLPYALPSLYSIFNDLNSKRSQHFIPELLNTKILQKHGIRLAFKKLSQEEVKKVLGEVLTANKNYTIRHVAFKLTIKLLCNEKDDEKVRAIWYILNSFLDNITEKDNNEIYSSLLDKVADIPLSVRPMYYIKTYNIFKNASQTLYNEHKYSFENTFRRHACEIIDILSPDFISDVFTSFIDEFFDMDYIEPNLEVFISFLLSSNNEESQIIKYNNIVVPLLSKCFERWNDKEQEKTRRLRLNLNNLLDLLRRNVVEYVFKKNKIIPIDIFKRINKDLEVNLDYPNDYLLLTKWHITVAFVNNINKNGENDWDKACTELIPSFVVEIKNLLKSHSEKFFTNIYILFAKALYTCLNTYISSDKIKVAFLKCMLQNETNVQVYLTVMKLIKSFYSYAVPEDIVQDVKYLCDAISRHQSTEVQIHYYNCRNVHLNHVSDDIFIEM